MKGYDLPPIRAEKEFALLPLELPIEQIPFTVVDVETTGLTREDRIIEIACVRVVNFREVSRFQSMVNPGMPINPAASEVSGIRDEDVQQAPIFAEIAHEFDAITKDAVFVAHNAPFDLSFISRENKRWDRPPFRELVLDTLKMARNTLELPRYSLKFLQETLALDIAPTHRAMADVEATTLLLRELIDRRNPKPESLGVLLKAQELVPVTWDDAPALGLPAALIKLLVRAAKTNQIAEMDYESHTGTRPHWLRPLGVLRNGPLLYLQAAMMESEEVRTYRFDRIQSVQLSGQESKGWDQTDET
jgi:DNA polymerase III epsilon subunit family exonuclease